MNIPDFELAVNISLQLYKILYSIARFYCVNYKQKIMS